MGDLGTMPLAGLTEQSDSDFGSLSLKLPLYTNLDMSLIFCSSNFLSGAFLSETADSLINLRGENQLLFKGLNLSFNLDRGHGDVEQSKAIRAKYRRLCQHFFCMILYEDPAEPARHEHMAQM